MWTYVFTDAPVGSQSWTTGSVVRLGLGQRFLPGSGVSVGCSGEPLPCLLLGVWFRVCKSRHFTSPAHELDPQGVLPNVKFGRSGHDRSSYRSSVYTDKLELKFKFTLFLYFKSRTRCDHRKVQELSVYTGQR